MKKTKIFKRVLIFVMVFSLVVSLGRTKQKVYAINPLAWFVVDLVFIAYDAYNCIKDEGKFESCVIPIAEDVLTAYLPGARLSSMKKIEKIVGSASKLKIQELFKSVKISEKFDEFKKSNKLIIGTYDTIRKINKGTIYEVHHNIEHRKKQLASALELKANKMISVLLHPKVHSEITKRWIKALPRNKDYKNSLKYIFRYWRAINRVYHDIPIMRKLAKYELYSSEGFWKAVDKIVYAGHVVNAGTKMHNAMTLQADALKPLDDFDMSNTELMDSIYKFNPEQFEKDLKEKAGIDLEQLANQVIMSDYMDVTSQFADKTIKITSAYTGNVVKVDPFNSELHVKHLPMDDSLRFQTQLTSDGWLGLKHPNGKWLSASSSGASRLKVNADALYAWECFRIYTDGTNHYIYSQKTKKVITVSDKISSILSADDENFERAKFIIEDVNENKGIKLRAPDTGIPENWGNVDFSSNQGFHPIATEESYVTDKHYIKTAYIRGYYTGSWRNGTPNGFGTLVYDDASLNKQIEGIQYSGEFVDGVPIGKGQKVFETYKLDGNFYGFFAHNKTVFDGKIIYTKGQDAGRVFKVRQVGVGDRDSKFVDWEEIKGDSYDSLVEELRDIPESSSSYTKGEHLDEGWVGGSTSISNQSTNQIDFVPSYELKNIDAKTYMPSSLGNYVENKHYVFSNFIRGHYTGNWENGKPSGYGTLVYDDYSENKKNGWIEYRGEFSGGIPFGNGQKIHKEYYLDGRFYGLFKAGKKVFEGKIVYTKGADAGRQCTATQIATGATNSTWTDMVEITE